MTSIGRLFIVKRAFLSTSRLYFLESLRKFGTTRETFSEYKTMSELRSQLVKLLESEKSFLNIPKSKEHLMKYVPKSQADLPVRKMKDSFDSAIVPLSSDIELRDKYTTSLKYVRLGRLMEDIDLFAVWCSTKHLFYPNAEEAQPPPYTIVTVHVDSIELINSYMQPTSDIRVSGHVCWVGKSSLEVVVWLDQQVDGKWDRVTRALVLMAARNPLNTGPGVVNPIEAETPEEKELLLGGEKRKLKRLEQKQQSLLKTVPTKEELHLIHDLFIKTVDSKEIFLDKKILPSNSKWMQNAVLENLVFCHPEYRNLHNKIFGGFLIRQAVELSWMTAYIYGMQAPRLVHISDIGFYTPVDLGSLLKFNASVTYAEDNFIQVFVYAEAYGMTTSSGKTSTSFYFTYDLCQRADSLYPLTYLEAMKYIEGRRYFQRFKELKESNI